MKRNIQLENVQAIMEIFAIMFYRKWPLKSKQLIVFYQ